MRGKKHRIGEIFSLAVLGIGCLFLVIGGIQIGRQMAGEKKKSENSKEKIPYENVTINEAEVSGRFYYDQLSETEQRVYREIFQGIQKTENKIYLHDKKADRANRIFQDLLNDRPEIFWCDGNATSTEYSVDGGQDGYVTLEPNYIYRGKEKKQREEEITKAKEECLSGIDREAGEYEKIKYIYTYLIENVTYDIEAPDNQNIYSAMVGKRTVCAGYAKSCQYLLNELGIYCIYVTGQTTDPTGAVAEHAWNIVACNGQYYYVDATWGDPVFLGEEESAAVPDLIAYDYLCCSARELEKTHKINTDYDYPKCESEDLNYYQLNGMYFKSFDYGVMRHVIFQDIENQEPYTIFKMADNEAYQITDEEMRKCLMEEGARYLGELYGLERISYSYSEEAALDKFIIYWFYE